MKRINNEQQNDEQIGLGKIAGTLAAVIIPAVLGLLTAEAISRLVVTQSSTDLSLTTLGVAVSCSATWLILCRLTKFFGSTSRIFKAYNVVGAVSFTICTMIGHIPHAEELQDRYVAKMAHPSVQYAQKNFGQLDRNDDGNITAEELQHFRASRNPSSEETEILDFLQSEFNQIGHILATYQNGKLQSSVYGINRRDLEIYLEDLKLKP